MEGWKSDTDRSRIVFHLSSFQSSNLPIFHSLPTGLEKDTANGHCLNFIISEETLDAGFTIA
jgi:hypothetical protein